MSKKIIVSEGCIGCGLCLNSEFMDENSDGKAKVAGAGVISSEQESVMEQVIDNCPVKAISLETVVQKSKEETIKFLESKPLTLKLSVPPKSDFKFDEKEVFIELPYETGDEYEYKYTSYKQALEAGKDVIRRNMFGNRVGIVQDIIGDYLTRKFGGYVEYSEAESNFYYSANCKAQKILDEMVGEVLGANSVADISENLKTITTRPSGNKDALGVGALSGGLMNAAGYIIDELSDRSLYSLDSYVDYIDYDEMDTYTRGSFGREKVVTKYCYKGIMEAYQEIAKDIRSALGWSFDETVTNQAYDSMEYIIGKYEKALVEELQQKAEKLKQLL